MAEYQASRDPDAEPKAKSGPGRKVGLLLAAIVVIAGVLFLTGFWDVEVTDRGSLPDIMVSADGGQLPKVDVTSKEVIVGTKQTTVEVPTVEVK